MHPAQACRPFEIGQSRVFKVFTPRCPLAYPMLLIPTRIPIRPVRLVGKHLRHRDVVQKLTFQAKRTFNRSHGFVHDLEMLRGVPYLDNPSERHRIEHACSHMRSAG